MSGFIEVLDHISTWIQELNLPIIFNGNLAVVYNNKIHILSTMSKQHYSWDGTTWTEESTLPLYRPFAIVVYNNKIHILGDSTKHYSWDGTTWTQESTISYKFYSGFSAVVYDNKIHILGYEYEYDTSKHYSWDGTTWTQESTLPYDFIEGSAVVYDNKIHILGDSEALISHYSWDGTTWTQESTLPYDFIDGSAIVYNGKIHILGGSGTSRSTNHYSWDGTTWTQESTLPYEFYYGSAVVYDNKIHILGGSNNVYAHFFYTESIDEKIKQIKRAWINTIDKSDIINPNSHPHFGSIKKMVRKAWIGDSNKVPKLVLNAKEYYDETDYTLKPIPVSFKYGSSVIFNKQIHILGTYSAISSWTGHYFYDGINWIKLADLPCRFIDGSAVVNFKPGSSGEIIFGKLHILVNKSHYSYDGVNWVKEADLPYNCYCYPDRTLYLSYNFAVVMYVKEIRTYTICLLGDGHGGDNSNKHYYYYNGVWNKLEDLPFSISWRGSVGNCNGCTYVLDYDTESSKWIYRVNIDSDVWSPAMTIKNITGQFPTVVCDPEGDYANGGIVIVPDSSFSSGIKILNGWTGEEISPDLPSKRDTSGASLINYRGNIYILLNDRLIDTTTSLVHENKLQSLYKLNNKWTYGFSPISSIDVGGFINKNASLYVFDNGNVYCLDYLNKISIDKKFINYGSLSESSNDRIYCVGITYYNDNIYMMFYNYNSDNSQYGEAFDYIPSLCSYDINTNVLTKLFTISFDDSFEHPGYFTRKKSILIFDDCLYYCGQTLLLICSMTNGKIIKTINLPLYLDQSYPSIRILPKLLIHENKLHLFMFDISSNKTMHYILEDESFVYKDSIYCYINKVISINGIIYSFDTSIDDETYHIHKYDNNKWITYSNWPFEVIEAVQYDNEILVLGSNYEFYSTNISGYFS